MNNEKKQLTVKKDETFSLSNPSDLINFASTLKDYIKDQNLYSKIQGKAYVNVEGWQFAGAFLGLIPIVEEVINEGSESEYKYRATVKIINSKTGQVSGAGVAICSNKEKSKRGYDEYAIASTAQTRAIGKAYRNLLAWIIKAAGYEPTPAEEMVDVDTKAEEVKPEPKPQPQPEKPPVELATTKQKELIIKLSNSHVFKNDSTVKLVLERINSNELTKAKAIKAIDWMEKELKDRKEIEKMEQEAQHG